MKNIKTIFKVNNKDFDLYAINIDEDSDTIKINSNIRVPELYRGNVGDLCVISPYYIDDTEVEDTHKDVLLQRVEIWNAEPDDLAEWRYIFLKN